MRKLWAVTKKEIKVMFHSSVPYIGLGLFALIIGVLFNSFVYQYMLIQQQQFMFRQHMGGIDIHVLLQGTFKNIHFLFLILIPFLTMRILSEERANETSNLLFSVPLRVVHILGGKFLAVMSVVLVFVVYTVFIPVFCLMFSKPDVNMILYSYVGFVLVTMSYVSIGLFCSAITKNQLIAGVLAFIICFAFFLFGILTQNLQNVAGEILGYLSVTTHAENFFKGVFSFKDTVYFGTFIVFWLFLAHQVLDSQSWR